MICSESSLHGGCNGMGMNPAVAHMPAAANRLAPMHYANGAPFARYVGKGGETTPPASSFSLHAPPSAPPQLRAVPEAVHAGSEGFSLVQNLASACGASQAVQGAMARQTSEAGNGLAGNGRQMSDEEVFSMFADELRQMEQGYEPKIGEEIA